MRPRQQFPEHLAKLVRDQSGVITSRQLNDGGLSRSVIARMSSDWRTIAPGLHLLAPPSFEAAMWAGLLRGGDEAVVGAHAAGYLHGAVRDAPREVLIWSPLKRASLKLEQWRICFSRSLRVGRLSMRVTRLEDALLDIADRSGEDEAISALARALSKGLTTPSRVMDEMGERLGVRHSSILRDLCGHAGRGIESALEWRFHQLLAAHGLPIPERQVQRAAGRVDGLYRQRNLIVELDGLRDHADPAKDMRRDNDNLIHHGSPTLRYGWHAVIFEPCAVARQVASLLWRRGWREPLIRCGQCLAVAA